MIRVDASRFGARSPEPGARHEPGAQRLGVVTSGLLARGRLWALGSGLWTLGFGLLSCHQAPPPPPPSVPVGVASVRRTDVPLLIQSTGTVEPIRAVAVQAQVSGLLLHVRFKEGDEVREGQVLFEIDPRSFAAALDQAEGSLARDQASWTSAQRDVTRYQALASKEYVTQQQLDQARAAANALAGTMRARQRRDRPGEAEFAVRHHSRADHRPRRVGAGQGRQSGPRRRSPDPRRHQPDFANSGALPGARRLLRQRASARGSIAGRARRTRR